MLIVDDDPVLLDALREMIELRLPNVRVTACDSGIDALAAVATREYDAIVADVRMPAIDGMEVLKRISPYQADTPVILISGHGELLDSRCHASSHPKSCASLRPPCVRLSNVA